MTPSNKKTFGRGIENLPTDPEEIKVSGDPDIGPPADSFSNAL